MKNSDVKRRAIARVTEMLDFLVMETLHCDELKHYQGKVETQLKYDMETLGLDFIVSLLKNYRTEIIELKQAQKINKIYRAATEGLG